MDTITANALANEARRQEATARVARLEGEVGALAVQSQALSSANMDAMRRLGNARNELAALISGAGPGLTDEFGDRSALDQLLRAERFAGKAAAEDYVRTHPEATEEDAAAAWRSAGLVATGLAALAQDPLLLGEIYRQRLADSGRIPAPTWEAQRAWILATTTDKNMAM